MTDRLTGIDALNTLPFKNIALPKEEAVSVLRQNAMAAKDKSIDYVFNLNPQLDAATKDYFLGLKTQEVGQGGLVINSAAFDLIYSQFSGKTFSVLVDGVAVEIAARGDEQKLGRNRGCASLGSFIDLSIMIPDSVATFNEKAKIFLNRLQSAGVTPFVIGALCDDAAHLRATEEDGVDLLVDRLKVIEFAKFAIENLDSQGKAEFLDGLTVDRQELYVASMGNPRTKW